MNNEPTDPHQDADMLDELYEQGYCYDCGELNCTENH